MRDINRRGLLGAGLGAAAAIGLAGCGTSGSSGDGGSGRGGKGDSGTGGNGSGNGAPKNKVRLIGDGSTADTGKQPHQPETPVPLEPGQKPPQFVIFSWDGAGESRQRALPALSRTRQGTRRGDDVLPLRDLSAARVEEVPLRPPNNPRGASDIGYLTDDHVKDTLKYVRQAWLDGHEIGTHFNGHFCGGSGSVERWTPAQWHSEINQAVSFVTEWRTNTGWENEDPLPFDYRKELVGGRTLPARPGQPPADRAQAGLALRRQLARRPPDLAREARRRLGTCRSRRCRSPATPSRSSRWTTTSLPTSRRIRPRACSSRYPGWRKQATDAYLAGFQRAYESNRAPFYIGNHFEEWNGGIYMDAVEEVIKKVADKDDVRLVSFRQYVDWLDAQDPAVLAKLRTLDVGQPPAGGWNSFFKQA